ncbi:MAG TPA: hypothetical protein VIR01_16525 [Pyrinomonadaceae bacterium]
MAKAIVWDEGIGADLYCRDSDPVIEAWRRELLWGNSFATLG